MKKDVNELKKMFFDLVQNPSVATHVPVYTQDSGNIGTMKEISSNMGNAYPVNPSVIYKSENGNGIQQHEEVEESLSIVDKEKELIIKALKKHRGKRKDASIDLGISERTLYRKLKEYDIDHL
jgi:DNA-binding NtrC family response regulator